MEFLTGLTNWCVLGRNCHPDWAAWGAIGTVAAVVYAVISGRKAFRDALAVVKVEAANALRLAEVQSEHARQLQQAEWNRNEALTKENTARLAHAFHRDLLYAGRQLNAIAWNARERMLVNNLDGAISAIRDHFPVVGLETIDRFADRLEGFATADALAILNALGEWRLLRDEPFPLGREFTREDAQHMARVVRNRVVDINLIFIELQKNLVPYIKHIPDLLYEVDQLPEAVQHEIDAQRAGRSPVHPSEGDGSV